MLEFIRGRASERKLRLFAAACFHRVRRSLPRSGQQRAIEVLEEMAEGQASLEVKREAAREARRWIPNSPESHDAGKDDPRFIALMLYRELVSPSTARHAAHVSSFLDDGGEEQRTQGRLFRCIVGNPFSPVTINPIWMTATVKRLAEAIYEARDFERLPVLGDALEDAGCTNADVLRHCREPGLHVRGCWVVDLLLGRS
jgi:hypothetical protein